MTKFCEDCPLRGECTDTIARVDFGDFESFTVDMKLGLFVSRIRPTLITLEECVDVNKKSSRLFRAIDPTDPTAILPLIEDCRGPITENKPASFRRLERAEIIKKCGALGIAPNALETERQLKKYRRKHDKPT